MITEVVNCYLKAAAYQTLVYVGGQVATLVGSTATWTITFSLSGGTDSTPQAGDLVLVGFGAGSVVNESMDASHPSGYTTIGTEQYQNDSNDANSILYRKFMGGTPDANVTLSGIGATSRSRMAGISVWRNVDTTTPLDVAVVENGGTNTGLPVGSSLAITPVTPGAVVVSWGFGSNPVGSNFTSSNLSAFLAAMADASSVDGFVGMGYAPWSSGLFTPDYAGGNASNTGSWTGHTVALRPAPA